MLVGAAIAAQGTLPQSQTPAWGAAQGNFEGKKLDLSALNPKVDIHPFSESCKTGEDRVYAKSGNIYYACINHKDICSVKGNHNTGIPLPLREAFDAQMAALEARSKELKAQRVARGRSIGNEELDRQNTLQRRNAVMEEVRRAQAEGRRPNLAAASRPQTAAAPQAVASYAPSAPAPKPAPVSDDVLKEIAVGTSVVDVTDRLGRPYSRIAGDSERLTYLLTSGKAAKLEFEGGKLTQVRIVAAP